VQRGAIRAANGRHDLGPTNDVLLSDRVAQAARRANEKNGRVTRRRLQHWLRHVYQGIGVKGIEVRVAFEGTSSGLFSLRTESCLVHI
jgi:hypothetical protein